MSGLIAASMALTLPSLIAGNISDADYPGVSQRSRAGAGTVSVYVQIDPEGRVQTCNVRMSGTTPILDQTTCNLVQKRFRYKPALDQVGKPITAVTLQTVHWRRGGTEHFYSFAEMALTVNKLPKGLKSGEIRQVALLTDKNGKILICQTQWQEKMPTLEKLACQQATVGFKPTAVTDRLGNAVEAVRVIGVRFNLESDRLTQ